MARFFYTLLFYSLVPLILLRLAYRASKAAGYRRRIHERFGCFSQSPQTGGIWLHAVSVGETIAAAPLVRSLQQHYPGMAVTLTTMTPTGSERVRALFGDSVFHVYAPYDLPGAWRRFLRKVQPRLAVVMETELWPNCVAACRRSGIPVMLANARLSESSARGYGRLGALTRQMLQQLSLVAAQTGEHGRRFVELGLPAERLRVTGSLKFDLTLDASQREQGLQLKSRWGQHGQRLIWIAASTHDGEEAQILAAHRVLCEQIPNALLVLVPRHPERFEPVARQIRAAGFSLLQRSSGQEPAPGTSVLLGDTMGELMLLFGAADIAFIGGSLVARGGHNTLEPAAWGLPLLAGPSDFNFPEVSRLLQEAGALQIVANAQDLAGALLELQADADARQRRGEAAAAVVAANRGALQRQMECIAALLE